MAMLAPGADPKALIPGDPDVLRELHSTIGTFAQGFSDAADHLTSIANGQEWTGQAAQAFTAQYDKHLGDYRTAGDAFGTVLSPLAAFADTLEWAQGQAARAVSLMDEAQTATQRWQEQAQQAAAASPPTDPGPDPGIALRDQAGSVLTAAVQQVDDDGRTLGSAANAAADPAPKKPGFWSSAWHDVTSFADGLYDSVSGLVKFVWDFSPIRMAIDPAGYAKSVEGLAKGLWFGVQHPLEFGKAVIDWKDWSSGNWARAVGELLPTVLMTVASGGAGAAADGADAAATLERVGSTVSDLEKAGGVFDNLSAEDKIAQVTELGYDPESAAGQAAMAQLGEPYGGVDAWENGTLQAGQRVAFGTPGVTGFGVTPETMAEAGSSSNLFEGVQVGSKRLADASGSFADSAPGYRSSSAIYEATQDIPVGLSKALANPQFGAGGLDQMYVPAWRDLVESGALVPAGDASLSGAGAAIEDPAWRLVEPGLPTTPLTVSGAQLQGAITGAGVGAAVGGGARVGAVAAGGGR